MGVPGRVVHTCLTLTIVSVAFEARVEARPTEGGLWSFEETDVVQTWDSPDGGVRVHFSAAGPNVTRLTDANGDGVPDYVQSAGAVAVAVLRFFADELDVRAPLSELEVGPALGGTDGIDLYLVDFGGTAGGRFGVDACTPQGQCAGFLVVENDFSGYGYRSVLTALDIVVSHELFHAVQAAYGELPVWISEGTATWATHRYDETLPDFFQASAGYLADPGRPIFSPPLGPVPAFAYGTALWWEFVTRRVGDEFIGAFLTELDAAGPVELEPQFVMEEALLRVASPLSEIWPAFVRANLATGFRAGAALSHPYAASLPEIEAAAEGPNLDAEVLLYPLAAQYWRLDHEGGEFVIGTDAVLSNVVITVHPVAEFATDGVVGNPIAQWDGDVIGSDVVFEDLPAGGYWLVATQAAVSDAPGKSRLCVGSGAFVLGCGIDPLGKDSDSGGSDEGFTDTAPSSGDLGGGTFAGEESDAGDTANQEGRPQGCRCRVQPDRPIAGALLALLGIPALRRRRRGHS